MISILHYSYYRSMQRWSCVQTALSCSCFFVGFCDSCSLHGQTMHTLPFGFLQRVSCRAVWLCHIGEGRLPTDPVFSNIYRRPEVLEFPRPVNLVISSLLLLARAIGDGLVLVASRLHRTMSVCKIDDGPSHKSFMISSSSTPSSHAVSIASPDGPCLFCCRLRFSMNSLVRVSR